MQLDDHLVKLQEREADLAVQAAQLQLAKAKDGLKQYQARRAEAEAAVRAARAKVRRGPSMPWRSRQRYFETGYSNKDRVGAAQAQLDGANALVEVEQNRLAELQAVDPEVEVKLAQLQADRSHAQLERARQEREEYLLRAPVDGTVLRVQAQEGDLVGPTSPRPAVWLEPAGGRIVRAEVSQEFAGRVRKGLAVQVEDEETAGVLAEGQDRRRFGLVPAAPPDRLAADRRQHRPHRGSVIDLDPGHARLRLGQRVRVRVLADQPVGGTDGTGSYRTVTGDWPQ